MKCKECEKEFDPDKSGSYMKLTLYFDEKDQRILKVPTFWDETTQKWTGFIQTPKSKKLISAQGKDSDALTNNFNKVLKEALTSSIQDEIYEMFEEE